MNEQLFNELLLSIEQAGAISRGELKPERAFSYDIPDVKAIREKTGLSQTMFAKRLNISFKTLQNWEQGRRKPTGPAVVLINLIEKNPQLILA